MLKSRGKARRKEKSSASNWTINFLAMLDLAAGTFVPKLNQVIKNAANTDIGLCQLKHSVEGRSRYKICRYKHDRDQVIFLFYKDNWSNGNLVTHFDRRKILDVKLSPTKVVKLVNFYFAEKNNRIHCQLILSSDIVARR